MSSTLFSHGRFRRPYPAALLTDGETVCVDLSPHWSATFRPVATAALCALAALAATVALTSVSAPAFAAFAVWLPAVYFGLKALLAEARRHATYFVVTSDRLIYRSGLVSKRSTEIPLERLNTVLSNQSAFERLLGCGDLTIESAGELGQQTFGDIARPAEVQNAIYGAIEGNASRLHGGQRSSNVAGDLDRPAALHASGSLSDEEYAAAKRRVIER